MARPVSSLRGFGGHSLRALLVILAMLLVQTASGAQVLAVAQGNDLFSECRDRDEKCVPYVTGVADTLELVAPHLTNICRPKAATIEQAFDVLLSWLEDHPGERHRPAAKLAGLAFAEAWPCD